MYHTEDRVTEHIDPILLPGDLLPDISDACEFSALRTIDDPLDDGSGHEELSPQVRE